MPHVDALENLMLRVRFIVLVSTLLHRQREKTVKVRRYIM